MTKEPIMIDGVDVYECEHFREEFTEFYLNDPDIDYINYCCAYTNECKKHSDCYYKQLKRKEQECEQLEKQLQKYRSVLEDIREDMKQDTTCESRECGCDDYAECLNCIKETILNKISEVEDDI